MNGKTKKCWGPSFIRFIRKICDINGFEPPLSAAAVRASAQQRFNKALTENVQTSYSDHRDLNTLSVLYQHTEHERRRTYARWFWAGGRAPDWTCRTRQHGDASRVFAWEPMA